MARFPTVDEYKDKPTKGVQRCDDLLKRDPNNVTILITKLQLQTLLEDAEAAKKTLSIIYGRQILDLSDISTIEDAVIELQALEYPPSKTAGAEIAKLWDTAFKATANINQKLDLQSLRCTRAIMDHRLADAQQSLIQLKALLPKNRVFYMAHAALTQQLSIDKDDLQSRLAIGLARKAVSEKFDDDKNLDCRVPGQIFALQSSQADIDGIKERRFADSKQVFDALKQKTPAKALSQTSVDPSTVPPKEWLNLEISHLKTSCQQLMTAENVDTDTLVSFAANAVRLYSTATGSLSLKTYRPVSEAIFLAISALVKAWTLDEQRSHLLQAAYLADTLLQVQPKVHEAKVILLYLYTRLGLGRLAYIQWDQLSIREIQYDTFGHSLLSQISILHPHYLTDLDPLRIITHALGTYRRLEDKLAETHASVLSHGQTGMIFDLYDLRQCLRLSVTRRILALEFRRLSRAFGKQSTQSTAHIHPRLTDAWLDIKDNRDFAAAFDHGFSVERALHQQDNVERWMLLGLASDYVWCMSTGATPAIKDADNLLSRLKRVGVQGTGHEQATSNLIRILLQELVEQMDAETLKTAINEALKALYIDELVSRHAVLPEHIREVYLTLDAMHILIAFLKHMETKASLPKAVVMDLRHITSAKAKELQAYCKGHCVAAHGPATKPLITGSDDAVAKELASFEANDLTTYCRMVAEASNDAWAGAAQYRF